MALEAPETVDTRCPICRELQPHRVLKGHVAHKSSAVDGTFECLECGHVHQGIARLEEPLAPRHVSVSLIVSAGAASQRTLVDLFEADEVHLGDEIETEHGLVEVTGLETKEPGKRVKRAPAHEITTIWGKNIDQIKVHFAVNLGAVTRSFESFFGPEDEIAVGESFDLEGLALIADKIVTTEGTRHRGTVSVREIKRVWLRKMKASDGTLADAGGAEPGLGMDDAVAPPAPTAPSGRGPPRGPPRGRYSDFRPEGRAPRGAPRGRARNARPERDGRPPRSRGGRSGRPSGGRYVGPRGGADREGPRTGGPRGERRPYSDRRDDGDRRGGAPRSGRPGGDRRPGGPRGDRARADGPRTGGRPSSSSRSPRPGAGRSGTDRGPPGRGSRGGSRGGGRPTGSGGGRGSGGPRGPGGGRGSRGPGGPRGGGRGGRGGPSRGRGAGGGARRGRGGKGGSR